MTPGLETWEQIRRKPGLYLGECSLTALYHNLMGYRWAVAKHSIEGDTTFQLPDDFHDWVAYRLRFYESTSGWKNMLLRAIGTEEGAFHRFFELLDEHKTRKARVFALLSLELESNGPESTETRSYHVKLITYTDDPGFFVDSKELTQTRRLCCRHQLYERENWSNLQISIEGSGKPKKLTSRRFEEQDQDIVSRLNSEAAAYRSGSSPFVH